MLLIWLIARHAYGWATGPLEIWFTYVCGHCQASVDAMVRTAGVARARTQALAQQAAYRDAERHARRVMLAAACPSCGKAHPDYLSFFERAAARVKRRMSLRGPLAVLAALLVLGVLGHLALRDLGSSYALGVTALAGTSGVALLVFALLSLPAPTPTPAPATMWLSRNPAEGPSSWFLAQPVAPPVVPGARRRTLAMSFGGVVASLALVIGSLVAWKQSFRDVYVVNTFARTGDLVVRIDGQPEGTVGPVASAGTDVPFVAFEVRTNGPHTVTLSDARQRERRYTVDGSKSARGWVIAPQASDLGLCLASLTWYYGMTPPETNDDAVLNDDADSDVVPLPHRYDYLFVAPPASLRTESGGETKRVLRLVDCDELERSHLMPHPPERPGMAL